MQPLLLLMAFLLAPKVEAGKIIGGQKVKPHSRPYMAFLRVTSPKRKTCGGFLVREDFVLTAAHCWGSSIKVTLGAHNVKKHEETQQIIPMKKAIAHPDYRPKVNDIMLLQLQRKANLTATVSCLKLPKMGEKVKPGMVCSVAGWGRLDLNTTTNTLHEVDLKIQKDKLCTSRYKSHYNGTTQICVGDPKENRSSFRGDSGGPFVCNNVAQGIVSFGKKNGKPPRIYTRISAFLPWINRTMRHLLLQKQD
ncbi:cathepsin G-like [Phyllostomus discolor]|uniref:Cathepsin G-like n=1 Tax=Phyllostomus discolor TaxID=89673 RepID=A0A6J2LB94_9CHIR|nr:cathepsin G-like [Phyllostomus discolor]